MAFAKKSLYSDIDPREVPAYTIVDAARYLTVPYYTLHSWVRPIQFRADREYSERPLIERPNASQHLSFLNLIEGHIVKALLKTRSVPLADLRQAVYYCEREFNIAHLFVHKDFKVGNRNLFIEKYGQHINLSKGGQLTLSTLLDLHLDRVHYDGDLPVELNPFVLDRVTKIVSISPYVAFGKPVVSDRKITTEVIAERYELGETEEELARDYDIGREKIQEAILYESTH